VCLILVEQAKEQSNTPHIKIGGVVAYQAAVASVIRNSSPGGAKKQREREASWVGYDTGFVLSSASDNPCNKRLRKPD